MATVTFTAQDANLQSMVGKSLMLTFTLSDPATSGASLFLTDPVVVVVGEGTNSVVLQDNETMDQIRVYKIKATWLDVAGGYVSVDYPDWELFVPVAGGNLASLIPRYSNNPYMVFWQATEPNPWPVGTVWVDTSVNTATSGDVLRKDS